MLIAPSPPCRLGPATPLAVSAASLRARLWAWVALSGLVYARASAAVVVLVLRGTALPVRRGTPRLCAPVCSPLRPPGAAESVVPLAVVESTFGSTIPRQAFCSHRSVVGSPPLAFGHSPGCAPSPDRCRHPSCHPFPTGLELMLAVVRLVLAPLPRSLRRRASLGALPSASSLFLADRGHSLDSGVAPRLPFLSDRRRPPPITATGRSPDRVAFPLS